MQRDPNIKKNSLLPSHIPRMLTVFISFALDVIDRGQNSSEHSNKTNQRMFRINVNYLDFDVK